MKAIKFLVRLYYEMWADSIEGLKNGPYSLKEGQIFIWIAFTWAQSFNIIILLFFLADFFDVLLINYIPAWGPFVFFGLINFYLNIYKKIYRKYTEDRRLRTGGRALVVYFMVSGFLIVLYIFIAKLIVNITS